MHAKVLVVPVSLQSLMAGEEFQHILRVLNTNVDGKEKVMYAMTSIRGIGRRFANIVCKKAEVDMNKRYVQSSANLTIIKFDRCRQKSPYGTVWSHVLAASNSRCVTCCDCCCRLGVKSIAGVLVLAHLQRVLGS